MNRVHGLIYAYHACSGLGALGTHRTGASLPFCGRYRLIDFALSGMMNAGIRNVGVVMQRGYQSLMEHLSSGRSWNLSCHSGGLHLLPPFGLPDAYKGFYEGCMEALGAIYTYLEEIPEDYVLLTRGDLCANVDMQALIDAHMAGDADITAVCVEGNLPYTHHRFVPDGSGHASELLCRQTDADRGLAALETYILRKEKLLELVRWSSEGSRLHFHRDALNYAMSRGWKVGLFLHRGYAMHVTCVEDYFRASMDLLDRKKLAELFPSERRVATRARSDVSSYYGDGAVVKNSLIADGCRIEGTVENCVIFGGVTVGAGAEVRNCIVMNDTVIGGHTSLNCVISDKNVVLSPNLNLCGSEKLPLVIPKGSVI